MNVEQVSEETKTISLLGECNTEISRLEAMLDEQRRRRSYLEKKLALIRSQRQLSAVDRVPAETLQQILKDVVVDNFRDISVIVMVCRRWNQLVSDSPALWSTIKMKVVADVDVMRRDTRLLEAAIRNSGSRPLDVDIKMPGRDDIICSMASKFLESQSRGVATTSQHHEFREDIVRYFKDKKTCLYEEVQRDDGTDEAWFSPYIYMVQAMEEFTAILTGSDGRNLLRLRSLSLVFDGRYFQEILVKGFFRYPTPILRELCLWGGHFYCDKFTKLFCFRAPKLTRLSTNIPINTKPLLKSNQLIELDIAVENSADFKVIFNNAGSIQRLSVFESVNFGHSKVDFSRSIFPSLLTLNLTGNCQMSILCGAIQAPNLKVFRCFTRYFFSSVDGIIPILSHTPELRTLCLSTPGSFDRESAEAFGNAIAQLQYLETVSILCGPENRYFEEVSIPPELADTNEGQLKDYIICRNGRVSVKIFKAEEDIRDQECWSYYLELLS